MSDNKKDNQKDVQNKKSTKLAIFNKHPDLFLNRYHTFLSNKLERLTSALYVITGFLPTEEPVRNRLRTCALELIHRSSVHASLSGEGVEAFRAQVSEIGVLLQTAQSAGLISRMNAELLCEEYVKVAAFVKENAQEIRLSGIGETAPDFSSIGQEDMSDINKKEAFAKSDSSKRQNKQVPGKGQKSRRDKILELLDKKNKISVKDASTAIPEFSEKTIQRELVALVQDGLAVKEGERRWSTYRRVTPPAIPEATQPIHTHI